MTSAMPTASAGGPIRVGLDIGGTKTDAVAIAGDDIIGRIRRASGHGDEAVIANVVDSVRELQAEAGFDLADVRSVGVGIPGLVDAAKGRVLHAVNLGVETLDLAALSGARLGVPVAVENDVKAAALGAAAIRGRIVLPLRGRLLADLLARKRPQIRSDGLDLFRYAGRGARAAGAGEPLPVR